MSWFLDFNVPVTCTGSAQDEMNKQKTGTKKVNKQQQTLLQRQQNTGEERRKKKNERKRKKRGGGRESQQTYKYTSGHEDGRSYASLHQNSLCSQSLLRSGDMHALCDFANTANNTPAHVKAEGTM